MKAAWLAKGLTKGLMGVAVVVGVSAAALGLTRLMPPLRSADESFRDLAIAYFTPPAAQHPGIVLVTLGEDLFATLACRSPVDRGFLADLVGRLEAAGVRAIGLDILFDQPTLPSLDERLRQRIQRASVPVVTITALGDTPLTEEQRRYLGGFLDGIPNGHANLAKDRLDGTVRWHVPRGPDGLPSFPARLAQVAGGSAGGPAGGSAGVAVPAAPFRIDWHARPSPDAPPFPTYPADMVGMLPRGWLAGRIAVVGTVLVGVDQHRTPLSVAGLSTPGVEIQAHALAQILDGRTSRDLSPGWAAVLVLALSAAGVALALAGWPVWLLVPASLLGLLGLWAAALALFAQGGPLVAMMGPSAAWLGGIAAMTAHLSLKERADRRSMMQLFANHVSQPVAEEIWRERATFLAGGRPRPQQLTATVFFSDIEGFTTVCEALEPEPLILWLEGYLDAMVRVVAAHDGIVLRFVGDAILAVFGAPVARTTQKEIDADAERAVRCAIQMGRELHELNRRWQSEGLPPIGIRVGIHTGPLVAGSLGGLRHMEYSLLGDTANTAARLEALGKTVDMRSSPHCRIVIGEPTWIAVQGKVAGLPVGDMALKGKRKAVRAWLVLDREGDREGNPEGDPEGDEARPAAEAGE